jgi:hypothetical protein
MGGPAAIITAISSVAAPSLALQAAAAGAFVYSSTCYVGQALSPLGLLTYNSIMDRAIGKSR